jgi:hypothetical protein
VPAFDFVNKNIRWIEIAVHYAAPMHVLHGIACA